MGRCPACEHLPDRGEAALSVLASRRMLGAAELAEVQHRIQRGEPLRPSAARLRAAEGLLFGTSNELPALRPAQLLALVAGSLLFSPLLPLAAAVAWRDTARGRQALIVVAASTVLLGGVWLALVFSRG